MTMLEECKVALRSSTTDDDFEARITALINTAKRDILDGSDIDTTWVPAEPTDELIRQTIFAYVCWQFPNDIDSVESQKWLDAYNIHRHKINTRSKYETAVT